MNSDGQALLTVDDLHVNYGSVRALRGLTFEVGRGEIVAIIGANGAGKSTCLNAIAGVVAPAQGRIRFDSRELAGRPAHEVCGQGIGYVPEGRRIFATMSVEENLLMGAFSRNDKQGIRDSMQRVYALFPRLQERHSQLAGTMSGGEQQMLATGRSLMSKPQLLLLDEPSMGLAPLLVRQFFDVIPRINQEDGTSVLLVEQNVHLALRVANRAYVLENGRIAVAGSASELRHNDVVRRSYLGVA